jgi:hypothetical protein
MGASEKTGPFNSFQKLFIIIKIKYQTPKKQFTNIKKPNRKIKWFGNLESVIWNLFVIWALLFGFFQLY